MNKINKIISYLLFFMTLTLSIRFVVFCYQYADNFRGYNGIGSEVFTLALPLGIVAFRLWVENCNKKRILKKIKK